ncbi:TA system VapC family ribonuclease toxin [Aquabacterium sp.]|uniref:TA system VapC family ribonuclease toxin n=1 Tax=Aquabacterium sp. TaxID=1872578 RepID=UPI002BCC1664|nr:TA system VapC family ribonuclease toxin [Aquabacterium sp.]HSW08602.1 TA system VapC family ribonuclease toxin [Aquabacterium sp.]
MKLPDTNVLIYAANRDAPQQAAASRWLGEAFDDGGGVGLSWQALLGFIRICTRHGILSRPLTVEQALQAVDGWLSHPAARVLEPGAKHAALLGRLLIGAGTAGNLTSDAHLAALAIEHGAILGSFDRDFGRFAGLGFEWLQ